MKLRVIDIINKDKCLSTADGLRLFEHLKSVYLGLESDDKIEIDFDGVTRIITAFLNAAYGQLYSLDDKCIIDSKIKFINIPEGQQYKFDDVRENAIIYYENKDEIDAMD